MWVHPKSKHQDPSSGPARWPRVDVARQRVGAAKHKKSPAATAHDPSWPTRPVVFFLAPLASKRTPPFFGDSGTQTDPETQSEPVGAAGAGPWGAGHPTADPSPKFPPGRVGSAAKQGPRWIFPIHFPPPAPKYALFLASKTLDPPKGAQNACAKTSPLWVKTRTEPWPAKPQGQRLTPQAVPNLDTQRATGGCRGFWDL